MCSAFVARICTYVSSRVIHCIEWPHYDFVLPPDESWTEFTGGRPVCTTAMPVIVRERRQTVGKRWDRKQPGVPGQQTSALERRTHSQLVSGVSRSVNPLLQRRTSPPACRPAHLAVFLFGPHMHRGDSRPVGGHLWHSPSPRIASHAESEALTTSPWSQSSPFRVLRSKGRCVSAPSLTRCRSTSPRAAL